MRSGMSPLHNFNYIILQWSKPASNPMTKKKLNLKYFSICWLPVSRKEEFLASFPADWWIPRHKESPLPWSTLRTRYYFTFPNLFHLGQSGCKDPTRSVWTAADYCPDWITVFRATHPDSWDLWTRPMLTETAEKLVFHQTEPAGHSFPDY